MVYRWGLFLVKKCNGVTLLTKIWPGKYCFVIVVLLTTHITIQCHKSPGILAESQTSQHDTSQLLW